MRPLRLELAGFTSFRDSTVVDFDGAEAKDGYAGRPRVAAQGGAHAGEEFPDGEGLGDVVIGSGVEGGYFVAL